MVKGREGQNILINFPCHTRSSFPLSISNCAFFDLSLQAFHVNYLPLLMDEKFRGTPPLPTAPRHLSHWLLPCHFSLSSLLFSFFCFTGALPAPLSCVLSTDNWSLSLPAPCGRNQSQNAAATAARHFNDTFRFGSGRVCCWRLLPLVGATSTCIFAVAELLASCVVRRRTVRGTSICLNRAEN